MIGCVWTDLSTRHLLALRAVAEEGTFGRAAHRLGFTQSAVSQQIAALEQLVGQPLFDRPQGPRAPQLTPAGELLLGHAVALIDLFETAEHDLDRFARGITGTLTIGTFQSISARLLPMTLRELHVEAPDVEIELVEDDIAGDLRLGALRRGELDLAFLIGAVDPDLAFVDLGADPHVALVPRDHPDGSVVLADLAGHPMVGQPCGDTCGRIVDDQLERLGVTPRYAFRSHDNGAVQGMVAAGVGIAIMPLLAVDPSDATISVRATEPALEPRRLSVAWNPLRTLPPIATRFVDIVSEVCRRELSTGLSAVG
jgi:DNA-binding transcriptional LysR family regulator